MGHKVNIVPLDGIPNIGILDVGVEQWPFNHLATKPPKRSI